MQIIPHPRAAFHARHLVDQAADRLFRSRAPLSTAWEILRDFNAWLRMPLPDPELSGRAALAAVAAGRSA